MTRYRKQALLGAAALALVIATTGPAVADPGPPAAALEKPKKDIRKAMKMIKDGHYVGTRGDGQSIDYHFCANGKFSANTGGGISAGKGWKVKSATFNKNGVVAIVGKGSFSVAIAKQRKQWKVGYVFGDEAAALGKVERTDGKRDCKTL